MLFIQCYIISSILPRETRDGTGNLVQNNLQEQQQQQDVIPQQGFSIPKIEPDSLSLDDSTSTSSLDIPLDNAADFDFPNVPKFTPDSQNNNNNNSFHLGLGGEMPFYPPLFTHAHNGGGFGLLPSAASLMTEYLQQPNVTQSLSGDTSQYFPSGFVFQNDSRNLYETLSNGTHPPPVSGIVQGGSVNVTNNGVNLLTDPKPVSLYSNVCCTSILDPYTGTQAGNGLNGNDGNRHHQQQLAKNYQSL